jgi:hypothetical protein
MEVAPDDGPAHQAKRPENAVGKSVAIPKFRQSFTPLLAGPPGRDSCEIAGTIARPVMPEGRLTIGRRRHRCFRAIIAPDVSNARSRGCARGAASFRVCP